MLYFLLNITPDAFMTASILFRNLLKARTISSFSKVLYFLKIWHLTLSLYCSGKAPLLFIESHSTLRCFQSTIWRTTNLNNKLVGTFFIAPPSANSERKPFWGLFHHRKRFFFR